MLEIRESKGFFIVSTYAKDRVTVRILGNLIESSYQTYTGLQYNKYKLDRDDIKEMINGYLLEDYNLIDASRQLAASLLQNKNLPQNLSRGRIPIYVIEGIHHFLEHNPTLSSGNLPIQCPLYEDCLLTQDSVCNLYGREFDIL